MEKDSDFCEKKGKGETGEGIRELQGLLGEYCRSPELREDFYSLKPSERFNAAMRYLNIVSPRRNETKLDVPAEPRFDFARRVREIAARG